MFIIHCNIISFFQILQDLLFFQLIYLDFFNLQINEKNNVLRLIKE